MSKNFVLLLIPDIDECKTGKHSCEHYCHDTDGSYSCSCKPGYQPFLHGRKCESTEIFSLLPRQVKYLNLLFALPPSLPPLIVGFYLYRKVTFRITLKFNLILMFQQH